MGRSYEKGGGFSGALLDSMAMGRLTGSNERRGWSGAVESGFPSLADDGQCPGAGTLLLSIHGMLY